LLPETKSPANTTPGASIAKKGSLTACSGDWGWIEAHHLHLPDPL
jgi:hypothetical protein